ncbi:MAG: prolyl oligopeptidase family serine peptidase [Candidatus Eisenbacteria bacterium]
MSPRNQRVTQGLVLCFAASALAAARTGALDYPATRTVDVVDDHFGTAVADPYRWLENLTSPEVKSWVGQENALSRAVLDAVPGRDRVRDRLRAVINYARYRIPQRVAGRYFWQENSGLQPQYVLCWSEGLHGEKRVLLDPNGWTQDGTAALGSTDVSDDGHLLLYGVSRSGSDWIDWHVLNVDTGKELKDRIEWSKEWAAWNRDATGFFYQRYPQPAKEETYTAAAFNSSIYFHRLGTAQSKDRLVYSIPEHPDWWIGATLNEARTRMILATGEPGSYDNTEGVIELDQPEWRVRWLLPERNGQYNFLREDHDRYWFWTNQDAPRGRVIAFDAANPTPDHWTVIIPEGANSLGSVTSAGGSLWASYMKDVCAQVVRYGPDGTRMEEVAMPGQGTAYGFQGREEDTETFYVYTDFVTPASVYRYDLGSRRSEVLHAPEIPIDLSRYESRRYFYRAPDGTAVPIFITERRGLERDGHTPTLLYAYGGFQVSSQPYFSAMRAIWLDLGGIYAEACIRGGGEYGERWHEAAIKEHRQVAFDDFIAAAQFLIDEGYTDTPHLAINGGSNGGLLVGAVEMQRPDLFGVCLPDVGVMDMLRFHLWGYGASWEGDYGNPEDPAEWRALFAYSPYHNIKPGVRYPATLVTTADTDDRVMPGHSFKFAARLQAAQAAGGPPILLRVETEAGHGGGLPIQKQIEEIADQYAFCFAQMGLVIPERLE